MGYWQELRTQWRALLSAMLGLASGFSTISYTTSIMAPHILKEFGWSKSQYAAIFGLGFIATLVFPFVGRMTDILGVRRTALIGIIAIPLTFLAITMISGDIRAYIAIFVVQGILCITTTSTVYSRVVVQYIKHARGIALAIVASGPALFGVFGAPLLNNFVEAHGWRNGYYAVCVYGLVAGLTALIIMPREKARDATQPKRSAKQDYPAIFRNRAFWILLGAMVLCNLPQIVSISQLNLVMIENGVSPLGVSKMISGFAIGMLIGRFVSGFCVDRMPAHLVATAGMMLSSIGLFLIASPWDAQPVLWLAVLLIGLSFGTETDLVGYLVVQTFGVRVFGSVMGMMTAAMSIASAIGSTILSVMLKSNTGYAPFLSLCGVSVFAGSLMFLLLPRVTRPVADEELADALAQPA